MFLRKQGRDSLTVCLRGTGKRRLVSAWADEHLFTVKLCLGEENP